MKSKIILVTVFLLIGFVILLSCFIATKNIILEVLTITVGVTLYHFAMRLTVAIIVNLIMKNQADHTNIWFREKGFEKKLYKRLRVRKWKNHLPTFRPERFDTNRRTVKEIIGATCQAEVVHEIIMIFSLLPIALIPYLGGGVALIITSALSMLIDLLFVILQRYNRPKLIRIMARFPELKGLNKSL